MASLDTFAQSLADLFDRQSLHEIRARADDEAARAEVDARLKQVGGWLYDPVGWAQACIAWPDGQGLTGYQREILTRLPTERRVAVRGPHGLGKTTSEALAVLWFATTRDAAGIDWKVVSTAGAWRQLEKYLWPEIHKWTRRLRWDVLGRAPFRDGRELLDLSLGLTHGEAFAAASSNAALLEGAHADAILYVFDEAKAIPPDVWDAAEGAFSGAVDGREAFALAQSTPGEPAGRFYDIHRRSPGLDDWWVRHVSIDEAVAARRVPADWAAQRRAQWGVNSAAYANRVLGEFHSSDEDAVIPLAWVEAAVDRWRVWDDAGRPEPPGRRVVGVDVARSGDDLTVQAIRQGLVVEELRVDAKQDTMVTSGKVGGVLSGVPHATAVVDTDGLGAGVTDRLRELGFSVVPFHAGAAAVRGAKKTPIKDRSGELGFVNVRSAAWWNLREMLDPAYGEQVCLPPDNELIGDLTAPHWDVLSGSKIKVESRDDIVKRLGRSPDRGTAVMQAFWTPSTVINGDSDGYVSYQQVDEFEDVDGYVAYG